ncbi:hypothetical protein GCM10011519_03500 [Marmoricola endophyticus]|uniref:Uncharacterized protein n=1 Tax=Marmoricola endophyticus TaxID=2040280 RepID=A0A917B9U0_9ACTN|nr:hypothetical protein [Marmoricola endophyticus]GGF33356.1 hypothetical protein GCM10011519_03500 [Marmoricola endophyticus]
MSTPVPTERRPSPTPPASPDPTGALFGSSSVAVHLVRGVVGLVLLVGALVLAGDHPWALLGLVGTVVAWRGCPTCWAMGLVATRERCAEGRCGRR